MKKTISSLIFSFLVAMGFNTSSNAIGIEGLGIGVSLGTAGYYAVGEEKTDNLPAGTTHTKEAGAFEHNLSSVFIEYGIGPIKVGLDYHIEDIVTPSNTNLQDSASKSNTVKAVFENLTTAYVIAPIWGHLYAKAGVLYVDIITQENLATGGAYGNSDTTGFTLGLGLDKELENGVSIRGEVTGSRYEDVDSTNLNTPDISVHIREMMSASAKISLVKTF